MSISESDIQFMREAREEARRQMYEDLAGTYERHSLSPRAQAIQDVKDAGWQESDFVKESEVSEEGEE
jgi:hypothetical protein